MTTFGLPTSMFLVFVATILGGSLGAIHYVIWHVLLGKPFRDEPVAPRPAPGGGASDARSKPGRADG